MRHYIHSELGNTDDDIFQQSFVKYIVHDRRSRLKGGGGGGQTTTTTRTDIPDELKPLYSQTGARMMELQNLLPLTSFTLPFIQRIAPLSRLQQRGIEMIPQIGLTPEAERLALQDIRRLPQVAGRRVTGEGIEKSPALQSASKAFDVLTAPLIENQLTLSGLGRSTALPQTMALAKTQYMSPLIQEELGREERAIGREADAIAAGLGPLLSLGGADTRRLMSVQGLTMGAGQLERDIEQMMNEAIYQDYLRRQALAEQALFSPFEQLPSTFGQTAFGRTRTSGGGGLFK